MKKNIILIFFGFLSNNIICEDYDKNNNINNEIKKKLKEIIKENKLLLENFKEKNKLILENSEKKIDISFNELNNKVKNIGDLLVEYNKINSKITCIKNFFIIEDSYYLYNIYDINNKIEIKNTLNEKFKEFLNLKVQLFNNVDILETYSINFKKYIDKEDLKNLEEYFLKLIKKYENL